ncbi:SIS domain-containing protein [Marinobacteraceae bacterium S3BR75-40.1]
MSNHQDYIAQHVASHMEAIAHAASENGALIEAAGQALVDALLSDGRILACGTGTTNTLAQYFCTCLLNRYEHDRPGLPAINLGSDATTFAALCKDNRFNDTFSRPIRALGKATDVLLLLADDGQKANLIQAIQAAHDRGMRIIAVTREAEQDIHALLHPEDVEIVLPEASTGIISEVMLVTLNTLCGVVEHMLFGH